MKNFYQVGRANSSLQQFFSALVHAVSHLISHVGIYSNTRITTMAKFAPKTLNSTIRSGACNATIPFNKYSTILSYAKSLVWILVLSIPNNSHAKINRMNTGWYKNKMKDYKWKFNETNKVYSLFKTWRIIVYTQADKSTTTLRMAGYHNVLQALRKQLPLTLVMMILSVLCIPLSAKWHLCQHNKEFQLKH